MRTQVLAALMAVLPLTSCSPNAGAGKIAFGETIGLSTTGNLRIITERQRYGMPPVVCTEPSPDYAMPSTSRARQSSICPRRRVPGRWMESFHPRRPLTKAKGAPPLCWRYAMGSTMPARAMRTG
nr:hypothetical protein RFYW14_02853 [Pseudorhizobium flavum]